MRRRLVRAGLISALLCSLVSCTKPETNVEKGNRLQILHKGNGQEVQDLDPQTVNSVSEFNILSALLEGLVGEDPVDLHPVPGVAERWEVSDDGQTYTFHLRKNAQWSNGDAVTARDFIESYRRILSPALAADNAYMLYAVANAEAFHKGKLTDFEQVGFRAPDDHTFVIHLTSPTPYFLSLLSNYSWFPVHIPTVRKYGPVKSGTSTVLRALGGLVPNASGTIEVHGRRVLLKTPRRAAEAGVLYVSNDRQREGLFLGQSVERNLTVTRLRRLSRFGVLLRRRVQRAARELATMAGVPVGRLGSPAASLSGGNQQKTLLGRALQLKGTALLALDEPTRGVDVGGRADIHDLVRAAARDGTAVIFSSTELDEVLDLADVVVTIFAGRIVSIVPRAQASASAILADMTTTHAGARRGGTVSSPETGAIRRFGVELRPIRLADAALAAWIALLVAVTVYGAATTTGFLTVSNLKAILTAAAFVGIIAVGLTVIVLSGNLFSLALGQTAAISAMVFLYTLRINLVAAILLTLLLGLAIGAVQGFTVGAWGANPIIVTIGAAGLMEGTAVWLSHGESIVPPRRRDQLGAPRPAGAGSARPGLRLPRSSRWCWRW